MLNHSLCRRHVVDGISWVNIYWLVFALLLASRLLHLLLFLQWLSTQKGFIGVREEDWFFTCSNLIYTIIDYRRLYWSDILFIAATLLIFEREALKHVVTPTELNGVQFSLTWLDCEVSALTFLNLSRLNDHWSFIGYWNHLLNFLWLCLQVD
jgi:hypothetical protein